MSLAILHETNVGLPFPSCPKDFQTLCPGFELAVAEEAAKYCELLELPQVIFYAMLLNEVERLGVLQGQALWSLELALTELRWTTFESWIWLFSDRIYEARFCSKGGLGENSGAGRQEESSGVETADEDSAPEKADTRVFIFPGEVVENTERASSILISPYGVPSYLRHEGHDSLREGSFIWRWRSATRPPHPLPEDFHFLCPRFSLSEAEGAAADFELPEIVQATFYAMLLNEAIELSVAHDFTAESMKSSLIGLRWSTFEAQMDCVDHALRGAQLHQSADQVEVRGSQDGQEEGSGSADPF
ncbi:LOW QUALITY PROTEIN: hypothetical protein Cgig2_015408 [Carnegiea gigantea]|uniref:Uncharacterized protein n=1 Tax=Carnegiea gigantea TaxID=171969 RepID=A0A9Q1QAZ0_9CARY|nr:LOW QUALITY PROTEIN: hypothetical protein Cgig2_015408 [Carnegiea gigantea]